jgi:RNA polymerase sigma factor (sigma-70 family)
VGVEQLFAQWYGRLVASIRRRLGDGDDAEDVAQEAFVRLLDEGAPAPFNARAWLFTVARRLASDRQRATRRRERLALLPSASAHGDSPDPALAVERAEAVAAVREVLAGLTERERQLLLLHHDGYSYREIAARIGVSPASVGSLLTRAHRRFLAAYDASATGSRSALP